MNWLAELAAAVIVRLPERVHEAVDRRRQERLRKIREARERIEERKRSAGGGDAAG